MRDHIDMIVELWAEEQPALDFAPFEIVGRVMRLTRIFESFESRIHARSGINRTEYNVLAALRRSGPPYTMSPARLGEALLITSGAMTKRLDALESTALVERHPDPRDRRALLVKLTEKGSRLVEETVAEDLDQERDLVAALTPEEQKQFADLARKLLASLERTMSSTDDRPRAALRP